MRGQTKSAILTSCALVFRRQSTTNTIAPAANALATDRTSKMCRRQANPKSRVLPQSNVKPVKRLQPQHEKSFTALPSGATWFRNWSLGTTVAYGNVAPLGLLHGVGSWTCGSRHRLYPAAAPRLVDWYVPLEDRPARRWSAIDSKAAACAGAAMEPTQSATSA